MKLSDLRAFVDIVDAGGLTAAAIRSGVTQPALSRLLRDLETRLQVQLLHRTGRGIELTPAGAEFLTFSTETLERYEELRRQIADRAKVLPHSLDVSVALRAGRLLIPDLHRDFMKQMPETTVHIIEEPSERAKAMLADGRLDAAMTFRQSARADREFVPLFSEKLFAVGTAARLGKGGEPISMHEVGALPLLLPSTGKYRELIQSAFRSAGHSLRTARELETAEGLLAFAAEGDGVAILPMTNAYQEIARGEVVARPIVDPEITRFVGVQFSTSMSKHTATRLLSVMRKSMQASAHIAAWERLNGRQSADRDGAAAINSGSV